MTIAYDQPTKFEDAFHVRTARQRGARQSSFEQEQRDYDERSTEPAPRLLDDLHDSFGLDWGVIAAVGGVSRTALRKWREGTARPDRSRWVRLVRLAVFCEALRRAGHDPERWLGRQLANDPLIQIVDLARVDRFDLLDQLRQGRVLAGHAHLAAFPNRGHIPGVDVKASLDDDGVVLAIPNLAIVAFGTTMANAESELLEMLRSYLDVATDDELGDLRWLRRRRGPALRVAVLGR